MEKDGRDHSHHRGALREAYKFGILNVDSDNKIVEFDEKPKNPRNNMAQGIYIFNWDILKYYLKKMIKTEGLSMTSVKTFL